MADIIDCLSKIKSAIFGKDVRQAIHDAIYCCYRDGKAGATDLIAREDIALLQTGMSSENVYMQTMDQLVAFIKDTVDSMDAYTTKAFSVTLDTRNVGTTGSCRLVIYKGLVSSDLMLVATAEMQFIDGFCSYRAQMHGWTNQDMDGEWSWGPLQWKNPPLVDGVEYLTTEKYNQQDVYVQRRTVTLTDVVGSAGIHTFGDFPVACIVDVSAVFPRKNMSKVYYPYPPIYNGEIGVGIDVFTSHPGDEPCALQLGITPYIEQFAGVEATVTIKYVK